MKQLFENPVLTGALGLMVSGALMYLLRSIPVKLFWAVWYRFAAELSIKDNNPAYHWAEEWIVNRPYSKRTKRLMVSQAAENDKQLLLVPGEGLHVFFDGLRPIWFKRSALDKTPANYHGATSEVTIGTLDIGRGTIEKIYHEIRDAAESRQSLRVYTCSSWGYWSLLLKREHRPLDTVFVDQAVKDRILEHITWYLSNKKWYTDRGIPYRTGLLLYGPPGTGKTSLVHALAGAFDLSVYMMNPSDLESENALRIAMASVSQRSILLIEDVDVGIASRLKPEETKSGPLLGAPAVAVPPEKKGPSLSAVLNALDGIAAADGRILMMTTNYPERLDEALVRDGRVDMRIEIGKLSYAEALKMAKSFFPEWDGLEDLVAKEAPKTGAEWQTMFANMSKRSAKESP